MLLVLARMDTTCLRWDDANVVPGTELARFRLGTHRLSNVVAVVIGRLICVKARRLIVSTGIKPRELDKSVSRSLPKGVVVAGRDHDHVAMGDRSCSLVRCKFFNFFVRRRDEVRLPTLLFFLTR